MKSDYDPEMPIILPSEAQRAAQEAKADSEDEKRFRKHQRFTNYALVCLTLMTSMVSMWQIYLTREAIATANRQAKAAEEANTLTVKNIIESAAQNVRMLADSRLESERSESRSKTALSATIANSRLDLRPWVVISRFQLSEEPQADKPFFATVWLVNSGKTPAINVDPTHRLGLWFSNSDPPIPNFRKRTGTSHFSVLAARRSR